MVLRFVIKTTLLDLLLGITTSFISLLMAREVLKLMAQQPNSKQVICSFCQADSKHPWTYLWVGFSGSKAENILSKTQLLDHYFCHSTLESKVLDQIVKLTQFRDQKLDDVTELQLIAELYKLLAFLMEELPSKSMSDSNILIQNYIKQTKKIIHTQYSKTLKVSQIAKKLNLNRSYLYKIFKEFCD